MLERRARTRRRRLRLLVLVAGVAIGVGYLLTAAHGRQVVKRDAGAKRASAHATPPPAAVEAGLLPWRLAAPLDREVVLREQASSSLLVVGGLGATGSSADGVYSLNTQTGRLSLRGSLPRPTHDAAGLTLGAEALVIGGGAAVPVATSEQITPDGSASLAAALPQPRADAAAVTIGDTAYVVGGYDGTGMDREVLATRNGTSYRPVAALVVPVRYPAVAALGGRIYVFGGATRGGRPVDTVQVVDPRTRTVKAVGRLPFPLSGAAAAVLGQTIYLAGGTAGLPAAAPTKAILAFELAHRSFLRAGSLPVAVANAGAVVSHGRLWIVGGETVGGRVSSAVQMVIPNRHFGIAGHPGAGSPFYGDRLLIADRGNNRLLVLNDTGKVIWTYPSRTEPAPPGGFYFPDDAFYIRDGEAIISNQEDNDTIVEIAYPSGRVLFQYGHPRLPGAGRGYLDSPDDTYLLRSGGITVADSSNCRVVIIDPRTRRVSHQIGTSGRCLHGPPTELGSPNGDTPLADGNLLISEVNGSWIDEYTPTGRLVWDTKLAIGYPSDPQQLGPDRYLVADYENPGAIVEFDRAGRISYRYQPTSGTGVLDHPSLVELLPSGVFMCNDDYNDRMVAIDPVTHALVWQYGVTAHAGTAPGLLAIPDGFDVIEPDGRTPTHPTTG
jgi:hypothetical protein